MMKRMLALLLALLTALLCACAPKEEVPVEEAVEQTESAEAVEQTEPVAEAVPEETQPDYSHINELEPDEDGVYQIHSPEGLANMANHLDGNFRLLCNIDMQGVAWTPVGTKDAPFTGNFDGASCVISNLTITQGADGYTGLFGVNEGEVAKVILDAVTVTADSGYVGTVAGENKGVLSRCEVNSGSMTLGAKTVAGSLVGKCEAGTLRKNYIGARMEADAAATVGLLGGELKNVTLEECIYQGPMNLKGGELFTNLAGIEENVTYTECLWRDNTYSSEFLSQQAQDLRDLAVSRMRAQGTIEWTVDTNISFISHNKHYMVGETYYGVPYTNMGASLNRFKYCFVEDGVLKDFVKESWIIDDLGEMYIGTDCSGGIYWSWMAISPTTQWQWTHNMLPAYGLGGVPVGDYDYGDTSKKTKDIYEMNGDEKMAECLAQAHKGDAVVSNTRGHTRMCSADPVVLRDLEGNINTSQSYILQHGQGDGSFNATKSTWCIDQKFSFFELLEQHYVPVSNKELMEGSAPECWVTVDNDKTGKAYMTTGTVESNYRLDSVTIKIYDEADNVVWEQTMFTAINKYATKNSNYNGRETLRTFNLATFAAHIGQMELEAGKTYTYELSAVPGTDEVFILKTFDFVQ